MIIKNASFSDFCDFCDAFSDTYKNNFSYNGKRALYDYLEEYEESTGEEVVFDIIALCCEYSEYETTLEAAQEYGYEESVDLEPHGNLDLLEVAALEEKQATEWLEDRTTVITFDGGIIIQSF